MHGFYFCLAV